MQMTGPGTQCATVRNKREYRRKKPWPKKAQNQDRPALDKGCQMRTVEQGLNEQPDSQNARGILTNRHF
jgi:hypothetical protein